MSGAAHDHDRTSRAWRRFRRNRLALAASVLFGTTLVTLLLTLPFSLGWFDLQNLDRVRQAPTLRQREPYAPQADLALRGAPGGRVVAGLGPLVHAVAGCMGTDVLGRSVLIRCLLGGVLSLAIGLAAAAVAVTLGVLWGAGAGLAGGRLDAFMMRVVDIIYGLPYLLLVILLKVALDEPLARALNSPPAANVVILFIVIGATSWLTMARVVRGQVLALKSQAFVESARISGAGPLRILSHHLLPNLVGPIVVYGALVVPQAILSESFLSFLGIGIQRPLPTWGMLAAEGLRAINPVSTDWWLIAFPCVMLSLTLLALNLIGDGLRDAFDPRGRP